MKNIVIIGMMGCGKSTCGRNLSALTGMTLVDTDQLITERTGKTPSEIFAEQGEQYFRDLETDLCRELSTQSGLIIATGGGLPLREENRRLNEWEMGNGEWEIEKAAAAFGWADHRNMLSLSPRGKSVLPYLEW